MGLKQELGLTNEMNRRTIAIIIFSIIIGLFVAFNHSFLSGTSPFIAKIFFAIIICILIWSLILIFRESNRKLRLIQLAILIIVIGIGFYQAKKEFDSLPQDKSKIYFSTDTELEN